MTLTQEQKITVLKSYGFVVGPRDPRLNTRFPGSLMVAEGPIEDYELPTEDGRDGPWCIVGDNLTMLVDAAFDECSRYDRFEAVCENVLAGGTGIL